MFEDRYYQINAEEAVFKYLKKYPKGHPLVALPTGSGKTAVMARIVKRILKDDPSAVIAIISHESQILIQNEKAMSSVAKVSVYSAGLGRREIGQITVAGIQSIFRIADEFKSVTHVLIDECHTIPMDEDSMYRKFLSGIGDHIRIGLTATPYRLGQGYIVGEGHMFDKIVIDLTFGAKFTKLVKDGFISNLVINNTLNPLDTTSMNSNKDFIVKNMAKKFDRESITKSAVSEMILKGYDRKKWLIFAIDIDHADNICDMLNERGISAMVVHSEMDFNKQFILDQYNIGNIKAIVNVEMLTTGFDQPDIDLIGLLRPTNSPNLHVQMIGRGLRVFPGKRNCMVLDYAGNTHRLGPINRIKPYVKKKTGEVGKPITKTCPKCDTITYPMTKICEECGHVFTFKESLEITSGDAAIIAEAANWFNVSSVIYTKHIKKNSPNSIVVQYMCGLRFFKEYVLPEHRGYAQHKSLRWLSKRGIVYEDIESTIAELSKTNQPIKIKIDTRGKYPDILDYEF